MPGPLREVLARFAVSVDDAPLSRLDKRINVVKKNIAKFAGYAATGFAAAGYAAYQLVTAASSADEALNVLQQTFKGNSNAVVEWSKTLGKEMGRSEYTLQDAAGRFGAFLSPVFKDSGQDIAAMSKQLTELGVDLGSFYNTTDEEAQMRLFSGMSGETEAVRRLGIDISDTSLDDLNKKNGDKRRLASLTLQEKTLLRFQKILMDTVDKQGDAARTANGWANSLKRVKEETKTAAVEIGRKLIPTALRLLNVVSAIGKAAKVVVGGFSDLITKTSAFETAALMAAVALGGFVAKQIAFAVAAPGFLFWAVAMTGHMLALAGTVAAVVAPFLLLEDLFQFFSGRNSVFGTMITEMTGLTQPLKSFEALMAFYVTKMMNHFSRLVQKIKLVGMALKNPAAFAVLTATPGAQEKFLNQGFVDPVAHENQRVKDNELQFKTAAESGDLQGAIDNHRGEKEEKDAARGRALEFRRAKLAIEGNQHLTTEADIRHGLAPDAAMLRVPTRAPYAPDPEAAKAAHDRPLVPGGGMLTNTGPLVNVAINITEADLNKAYDDGVAEAKAALNRAIARKRKK